MAAVENSKISDVLGTLADINRGNFVIEIGRKQTELVEACVRTRKKGKLVITLEIVPAGISEDTNRVNQFSVRPEVSVKKPEASQPAAIFFCTEDNKLTRDDPDQMEMNFHEQETTK